MKLHKSESGFSAIEVLLVIIILGILGFTGYFVYHAKQNADKNLNASPSIGTSSKQQTKSTQANASTVSQDTPIDVRQQDGSVTVTTTSKVVTSVDQAAVVAKLATRCSAGTIVAVSYTTFTDGHNYKEDSGHVYVNSTCGSSTAKNSGDIGDSGHATYLHKDTAGTWVIDAETQMAPSCSAVDGKGYPNTIVPSCYDGDNARAPKE